MTDDAGRGAVPDPFAVGLFGGSPKTETYAFATSTAATTVPANRNESVISSSVPETKSSFELPKATQGSYGDGHDIDATIRRESSAPFSGTRVRTSRRSLSDRLTQSLISAGLVRGITPSLTRKQSGQPIQVLALGGPVGGDVDLQKPAFSFLSGSHDRERSTS